MNTRYMGATALATVLMLAGCGQETRETEPSADGAIAAAPQVAESPPPTSGDAALGRAAQADGAQTAPGGGPKLDPGAKAAIVGSWAQARESCNSGEAIQFRADGTYGFEGEGGDWDLKADRLHFENVKLFEPGVEGETPGDPGSVKVLAVEADRMKGQMADGQAIEYVRCPGVP